MRSPSEATLLSSLPGRNTKQASDASQLCAVALPCGSRIQPQPAVPAALLSQLPNAETHCLNKEKKKIDRTEARAKTK